ncbi:Cytochrome c [Pelagimonas phthalicica]|uniref:Cytochrome c n=1 Tax=Pelagimonas phthalicica TaxID=1037362 RepID=A0A238JAJ1_9RHOB|nr:cytochrome c [Pelagimonas phthalicica]TDS93745.1 cytochrome c553 [Pelagimonas phthalicica]SMX27731.1 Cytochrome c [Pelagimonas phthalicica]
MKKQLMIAAAIGAVGIGAWAFLPPKAPPTGQPQAANIGAALVRVALPASLSPNAQLGQRAYETVCVACHGEDGSGRNGMGPPLVHKIYEPSHHGDEAFQRAVALGVRAHHWSFGDMAPVSDFTRADVKMIITYLRELQRANGIN